MRNGYAPTTSARESQAPAWFVFVRSPWSVPSTARGDADRLRHAEALLCPLESAFCKSGHVLSVGAPLSAISPLDGAARRRSAAPGPLRCGDSRRIVRRGRASPSPAACARYLECSPSSGSAVPCRVRGQAADLARRSCERPARTRRAPRAALGVASRRPRSDAVVGLCGNAGGGMGRVASRPRTRRYDRD